LGRQDLDLLLRAGKSGLCSDNARVGFLSASAEAVSKRWRVAQESRHRS